MYTIHVRRCNHNANGRCVHCSPLEPWDEDYLKEHNIKHMSFHAYLRKMTSGKFVTLEELSFKIKPGEFHKIFIYFFITFSIFLRMHVLSFEMFICNKGINNKNILI